MARTPPPADPHQHFLDKGVKLLVPYTKAKVHHEMMCLYCDHVWSTMPLSVTQSFKKYGTNSCPACNQLKKDEQTAIKQHQFLSKMQNIPHIEILSEYNGRQSFTTAEDTKVKFRNNICGHEFETYPVYILNQKTDCPVCGELERVAGIQARNESTRIYTDVTKARDYIYLVASYTRKSYLANKATINPDNLPIGLNGVCGAYQVDHIVSKAIGYKLGISPELISHPSNLQMLPWEDNLAYKDKFKGMVPDVLKEYFTDL